jgi:hypothetical protein
MVEDMHGVHLSESYVGNPCQRVTKPVIILLTSTTPIRLHVVVLSSAQGQLYLTLSHLTLPYLTLPYFMVQEFVAFPTSHTLRHLQSTLHGWHCFSNMQVIRECCVVICDCGGITEPYLIF